MQGAALARPAIGRRVNKELEIVLAPPAVNLLG